MSDPSVRYPGSVVKNEEHVKGSGFKSLFSIFRSSKPQKEKALATTYPTSSVVQRVNSGGSSSDTSSSSDNIATYSSTISLPNQIKLPFSYTSSPSSSSASSLDLASDASTTVTTPSNSCPSVLMKSTDTVSTGEPQTDQSSPKKRLPEGHKKQPSPLSTVTDAHNSLHLPSPPAPPLLHERPNSFQPKRRNSPGRLILRGCRSNPDLTEFRDGDIHLVPVMPSSAPLFRPSSSSGSSVRSGKFNKKTGGGGRKGRADLEKPTAYSKQEQMEHRSILGADPSGLGFYLYPKPVQPEPPRQAVNTMGYNNGRRSWSGTDSGRRAWREQKGRNYQRNRATPIIVEEEGGGSDAYNHVPPIRNPQRRHSYVPVHDGQWRQPRFHSDQPAPPPPPPPPPPPGKELPSIGSLLDRNPGKPNQPTNPQAHSSAKPT